jgi:hypothetical protein
MISISKALLLNVVRLGALPLVEKKGGKEYKCIVQNRG